MGWLRNLFRTGPKEEMEGIHLDTTQPYWETIGPRSFDELFQALQGWLPPNAVLYFEGGSSDPEINDLMATFSIPEQTHVAMGTSWPRPKVFHVPATDAVLKKLTAIMEHHPEPQLAVHFHVYCGKTVLIEWDDAFFDQPILISGSIPEEKVKVFADKIGKTYKKVEEDKKGFIETRFDRVEFPILVEDDKGLFHLFYNRQEILGDPDLVSELGKSVCAGRLIDSQGRIFTWSYSDSFQSYYPGNNEGVMTIEAVREMLDKYIGGILNRPVFGGEKSLKEIFIKIDGYVQ